MGDGLLYATLIAGGGIILLFLLTSFIGAPYVPSHRREVRRAFLSLRPLTKHDAVYDSGSGDGRVLEEALRAGAGSVMGVEINPFLALISRIRLRGRGRITIANSWTTPVPDGVTVWYIFGVGRDMARLERYIQAQSDRTRCAYDVITYGHQFPHAVPTKQLRAHHLYRFTPLQVKQP